MVPNIPFHGPHEDEGVTGEHTILELWCLLGGNGWDIDMLDFTFI